MTNHASTDLDYMSDLQNIELFYMIEGLAIEGVENWQKRHL